MKRERGVSDASAAFGGDGHTAHHIERSQDPAFGTSIQRIRARKTDMSDVRRDHMCGALVCNPQGEAAFYEHPLTSNVFVCRFGAVHLCSEYECPFYSETHDQICPISQLQLSGGPATSSYNASDSRTWYAKLENGTSTTAPLSTAPLPTRPRIRTITDDDLHTRASAMIKLLLFSTARIKCNNLAYETYIQQARDGLHTYRKLRLTKRQPPYQSDRYRLRAHFTSMPLPYSVYEFNANLHDYYVGICMQMWHLAMRFYVADGEKRYDPADGVTEICPRLDFGHLCLGVMYTMRQGRSIGGIVLLPKDDFLLINMPLISHLSVFNLCKNQVTKGEKILSQMYENAVAERVDPRILALNVSLLPQKREESVDATVKLGSNGEKLFMPTSRKAKKD
jgi:hypothetical protein